MEGLEVAGDLFDGLVQLAREILVRDARHSGNHLVFLANDLPPDAVQETRDAVDATVVPLGVLVGRTDEELVDPARVGPIFFDHVVGRGAQRAGGASRRARWSRR